MSKPMSKMERIVRIGAGGGLVNEEGTAMTPPADWAFLAAGDAGLTRKVIASGPFWRVQAQMGRRVIAKGLWAPAAIIAQARAEVSALRATEGYQKKLAADRQRRALKQRDYEQEFHLAVRAFLAFAPCHQGLEQAMAAAVTAHAIPVGSGTVARTALIPIEERAAKAVIAWMRHQTTAYDSMAIARVKGERREVRRMLARRSHQLLSSYRSGQPALADCPLARALETVPAVLARPVP